MEKMHILQGIKRCLVMMLVNGPLAGTRACMFEPKRRLLNSIGWSIGSGTKIVAPIECSASLTIGCDCWVGKNLKINGNGRVIIGDRGDIAPEVTFQTGSHEIGTSHRRAGEGISYTQRVGNGVWIGVGSTMVGDLVISDGSIVAACACVVRDVPEDTLVGGVPARPIRRVDI